MIRPVDNDIVKVTTSIFGDELFIGIWKYPGSFEVMHSPLSILNTD